MERWRDERRGRRRRRSVCLSEFSYIWLYCSVLCTLLCIIYPTFQPSHLPHHTSPFLQIHFFTPNPPFHIFLDPHLLLFILFII
ncbi:hypothetical protein HDK77DRAFT_446400 [Phyllosticta capitalensis]